MNQVASFFRRLITLTRKQAPRPSTSIDQLGDLILTEIKQRERLERELQDLRSQLTPQQRRLAEAADVVRQLIEDGDFLLDGRIYLGSWEGSKRPLDLYAIPRFPARRWP